MSEKSNLVQKQLEAYNAFNLEVFCSCYHKEVIVKKLLDDKILLEGINQFKSSYQKLFEKFPSQICILKNRIFINNIIIDEELITGRSTHPEGLHAVAIYGFRDELIDRVWFI